MLNTKRDKAINAAMTVLSLVIALAILFPIIWLVCSSFKQSNELFRYPLHMLSADPTAEHYVSVMEGGFMRYVGNSFFLAIVGTIITLVISSMCGYALAVYRNEIKYTNFVFGIFPLHKVHVLTRIFYYTCGVEGNIRWSSGWRTSNTSPINYFVNIITTR